MIRHFLIPTLFLLLFALIYTFFFAIPIQTTIMESAQLIQQNSVALAEAETIFDALGDQTSLKPVQKELFILLFSLWTIFWLLWSVSGYFLWKSEIYQAVASLTYLVVSFVWFSLPYAFFLRELSLFPIIADAILMSVYVAVALLIITTYYRLLTKISIWYCLAAAASILALIGLVLVNGWFALLLLVYIQLVRLFFEHIQHKVLG